jgi:hypothetical protein
MSVLLQFSTMVWASASPYVPVHLCDELRAQHSGRRTSEDARAHPWSREIRERNKTSFPRLARNTTYKVLAVMFITH